MTELRNPDIDEIARISHAVRGAIEHNPAEWPQPWAGFPKGACSDTSLILGAILEDAGHSGFESIWGEIAKPDGTSSSHGWLQRGALIVDITADQFGEEPVIVRIDNAWHRQWRVVSRFPGDLKEHKVDDVPELYALYHAVSRAVAARLPRLKGKD